MSRIRAKFLALTLFVVATQGVGAQTDASGGRTADLRRVAAISDIHGAYEAFNATLRQAGVIDDDDAWTGGDSHLVIVGDILDRGSDSRAVMDLLMRLEDESREAGGAVHVLIGNHEAMNLVGDLRYVSKGEYAAFAAEEDTSERERWFDVFASRHGSVATEQGLAELRTEFDRRYPPGYFAHRRAFAVDGEYGAWLLSKPILAVIDGTAFVHGGLSPMIADIGLDGVNGTLRGDLVEYVRRLDVLIDAGVLSPMDDFYSHPQILDALLPAVSAPAEVVAAAKSLRELAGSDVHAPEGPLWYRGNVACGRVIEQYRLEASLAAIGAERVVIGHTPTRGRRVLERFDGRIYEIDTGMLSDYYGGTGNVLILEGDRVFVVNEGSAEVTVPQPAGRQVGERPGGFLSTDATAALLSRGEITATHADASGRTIVTVADGVRQVDAVFTERARKGVYPELAAYRLDRLVGLDMVPVTVKRSVGRDDGTLQLLPAKTMDEQQRSANNRGGSAMCPLPDQWPAMYVFDALIGNEGRTAERIVYDTTDWQLILVGHDEAFDTGRNLPGYLAESDLSLTPGWRAALDRLTDDEIEREFADVLDARRRKALAARRDALLQCCSAP